MHEMCVAPGTQRQTRRVSVTESQTRLKERLLPAAIRASSYSQDCKTFSSAVWDWHTGITAAPETRRTSHYRIEGFKVCS